MRSIAKFALGLAVLLGVAVLVNAFLGDKLTDPSPASKQMRVQFEAIEKSAGIEPDRHGCQTLQKFVATQPFFYACPVSATQLEALRPALATRGWQPAPPSSDVGYTYLKGALRVRLACDPKGAACQFRLETIPAPAAT